MGVRVPMEFKRRGGRKEIIPPRGPSVLPAGAEVGPKAKPNRPLVLAIARAHRWQRMIDSGEVSGMGVIATQHGVDRAYVSRVIQLATLAPDIVGSILAGRELNGLSLARLHRTLPLQSDEQRKSLARAAS